MRQTILGGLSSAPSTTVTTWAGLTRQSFGTVEFNGTQPWAASGTFRNLLVTTASAPGAGKSITYTIRINGVDSALTVTLSGTDLQQRDITHAVTISAGDTVSIQSTVSGTPAVGSPSISVDFDSTNPGESAYGVVASVALSTSAANYNGPFMGTAWNATATVLQNIVAAAGSLTALYARLSGNPGTGKNYTLLIVKNGTAQDGSGGTTDTRVVIADAATSGSATFSLAVAAGDLVELKVTPSGTPTARIMTAACRFLATTDGESQMCGVSTVGMGTISTVYLLGGVFDVGGWGTTETQHQLKGGITPFTVKGLRVVCSVAPGAAASGKSRTFSGRKNTASPSGAPSATVLETATTASDTANRMLVVETDVFTVREVPASTPAAATSTFSWIQSPALYPDVPTNFPFVGAWGGGSFIGLTT